MSGEGSWPARVVAWAASTRNSAALLAVWVGLLVAVLVVGLWLAPWLLGELARGRPQR